jgi:valyl-tRNA synthetase
VNRIKKDIEKTQNEYKKVEVKLNNQNFMSNAPAEVRADVQEKVRLFQEKLQSLHQILDTFM